MAAGFNAELRGQVVVEPEGGEAVDDRPGSNAVGKFFGRCIGRAVEDDGILRPGISTTEARDVLWTYNSAELFQLLVLERGWSPKRYGRWIAEALIAALTV